MNKKNDEPSENNISSTTKKKRKIFNWLKKEKKKKNDPNASKGGGKPRFLNDSEDIKNTESTRGESSSQGNKLKKEYTNFNAKQKVENNQRLRIDSKNRSTTLLESNSDITSQRGSRCAKLNGK
ncbi:uncharacterized protein LOC120331020 isoform X1 [Styela clava]